MMEKYTEDQNPNAEAVGQLDAKAVILTGINGSAKSVATFLKLTPSKKKSPFNLK